MDWTGRPWQRPHGCWRLLCAFYLAEFGIALPTYDDQVPGDDGAELAALIADELGAWREVPRGAERYGDGVLLRIAGAPAHIGVVMGQGRMLHVLMDGHESCVESYRAPKWARRVEGFYRHRAFDATPTVTIHNHTRSDVQVTRATDGRAIDVVITSESARA